MPNYLICGCFPVELIEIFSCGGRHLQYFADNTSHGGLGGPHVCPGGEPNDPYEGLVWSLEFAKSIRNSLETTYLMYFWANIGRKTPKIAYFASKFFPSPPFNLGTRKFTRSILMIHARRGMSMKLIE